MALNRRQVKLYTFRVSLFKPGGLANQPGDLESNDAQTSYVPAFTNVACLYIPTPELDVPQIQGRQAESNLFTLDRFHFAQDQPIADTWVLKMTGSDPRRAAHPYIGRVWVIRDNTQVFGSQGRRDTGYQMAYALLEDILGISTGVAGIA